MARFATSFWHCKDSNILVKQYSETLNTELSFQIQLLVSGAFLCLSNYHTWISFISYNLSSRKLSIRGNNKNNFWLWSDTNITSTQTLTQAQTSIAGPDIQESQLGCGNRNLGSEEEVKLWVCIKKHRLCRLCGRMSFVTFIGLSKTTPKQCLIGIPETQKKRALEMICPLELKCYFIVCLFIWESRASNCFRLSPDPIN